MKTAKERKAACGYVSGVGWHRMDPKTRPCPSKWCARCQWCFRNAAKNVRTCALHGFMVSAFGTCDDHESETPQGSI